MGLLLFVRETRSFWSVLAANPQPKPGASFFPLTVDYREYTYAAGKFPGGFIKREGRPSEKEILTSRLIDRPVRPLFPEGFSCETQIIAMVLSADPQRDPSVLAIIGAGAALAISDIPFHHVLAGVRVGLINGVYQANPSYDESKDAKLNIVVAGTEQGIVMVEAGANSASEAEVLDAIEFGHNCCKKIADAINQLVKLCGKTKRVYTPPAINQDMLAKISAAVRADLSDALNTEKYGKLESYAQSRCRQGKGSRALHRRSRTTRSQEDFRRSEGTHLPRRNVERQAPPGWPQLHHHSQDHLRSRRSAPHPRFSHLHSW